MTELPARLRAAALMAVLIGAVGSVGLLLRAGQRAPRVVLIVLALWVLSPFVTVVLADMISKRWSVLTRAMLYSVTLLFALASLAIYAEDALSPPKAQAAFVFVLVPLVSLLLIAIVVAIAALISRRRLRGSDGAW